jgi:hypothetical protein
MPWYRVQATIRVPDGVNAEGRDSEDFSLKIDKEHEVHIFSIRSVELHGNDKDHLEKQYVI